MNPETQDNKPQENIPTDLLFAQLIRSQMIEWIFKRGLSSDNEFVVQLQRLIHEWTSYHERIKDNKQS